MRKIFLIAALLFTGLSFAQVDSTQKTSGENSYYGRRYPVFPEGEQFPEKGSGVTIFILSLFGVAILTMSFLIIRKSKSRGNRIIIGGFSEDTEKGMVKRSIPTHYNIGSSGIYSKRKGGRGGYDRRSGSGGIGGFGSGW